MKPTKWLLHAAWMSVVFHGAVAAEPVTIEVSRHGDPGARPIVFVPGLASSAELWGAWAEEFAPRYQVHIVGVKGFAGIPAAGALTIPSIAQDLAEYLAERDLNDAVIVGHSVGGMIAMQTANHSTRVGELVLIDSLPFTAGLYVPGVTPDGAAAMAGQLRTVMQDTPVEAFRAQQRAGLGIYSKTASFLPTLIEWSDTSDQNAVADIYAELLATDYRRSVADIDVPIHVLAAWDEAMNVPLEHVESLFNAQYESHRNTNVIVIEDTLHFIMIDQPESFRNVLTQVLGDK